MPARDQKNRPTSPQADHLANQYGPIGISAVKAAAQYARAEKSARFRKTRCNFGNEKQTRSVKPMLPKPARQDRGAPA